MQQMMQKWMAWMKELGEKGHIKGQGQPLERTGKLVKGKQKTVTDGPFAEAKDIVGGYTLRPGAYNRQWRLPPRRSGNLSKAPPPAPDRGPLIL
jgi:hypothetical protein